MMGGQRQAPAALPPGKTRYPLYRRLGEPQGRSGRVRKKQRPSDATIYVYICVGVIHTRIDRWKCYLWKW